METTQKVDHFDHALFEDVWVEVLIRICDCLDCTVDDILEIIPDIADIKET